MRNHSTCDSQCRRQGQPKWIDLIPDMFRISNPSSREIVGICTLESTIYMQKIWRTTLNPSCKDNCMASMRDRKSQQNGQICTHTEAKKPLWRQRACGRIVTTISPLMQSEFCLHSPWGVAVHNVHRLWYARKYKHCFKDSHCPTPQNLDHHSR